MNNDWSRIFHPRIEKAVKAISLIENGAAARYDLTEEDASWAIRSLEDTLTSVKAAYAERFPGISQKSGDGPPDHFFAPAMGQPSQDGQEPTPPSTNTSRGAESTAISSALSPRHNGETVTNTSSDQALVIPHWAQVKDFVNALPRNQVPAYILHLGDLMYEDAIEIAERTTK